MGRVCHGPSLYGPSLLWAEFVMDIPGQLMIHNTQDTCPIVMP